MAVMQDKGEVFGHWLISDELDCMPHWGDLYDLVSFEMVERKCSDTKSM